MIVINGRFLTQKITGVQRFAIDIAIRLKEQRNDVLVLAPKDIIHKEISEKLEAKIVKGYIGHLWEQITLPLYLNKINNPILLNLTNSAPIFYGNKITTICDISNITNPEWFSNKYKYFYRVLTPIIVRTSKKIITISEFSKNEIHKHLHKPLEEIEVVYCALPTNFEVLDKNLYIHKKKFFLCVSSINPRKNFNRTIEAFIKWNKLDYQLYIVGEKSNSFANHQLLNKRNENIKFLGRVSDDELSTLYKEAKGFLYLSLYEGFGIPPLEAQALNCPVLASDIPVLREVLQESAIFCDPTNIFDIILGIDKLAFTDIDLYIQRGKENIKRFDWSKSTQKISKIVKEI